MSGCQVVITVNQKFRGNHRNFSIDIKSFYQIETSEFFHFKVFLFALVFAYSALVGDMETQRVGSRGRRAIENIAQIKLNGRNQMTIKVIKT